MMAPTPISLNSVAVIGAHCGDIAIGVGATLIEIVRDNNAPQSFTRMTTISSEMSAFSGRESCNAVHAH
jgi:hypothetical protein